MVAQNVVFWILAVAMVLAAIGVVRSSNVVHAALYLVVVMAGAAAQYILLAAEFVWARRLLNRLKAQGDRLKAEGQRLREVILPSSAPKG